jgi:hypothetical protein
MRLIVNIVTYIPLLGNEHETRQQPLLGNSFINKNSVGAIARQRTQETMGKMLKLSFLCVTQREVAAITGVVIQGAASSLAVGSRLVSQSRISVAEVREQSGNPKKMEHPPLNAVSRGLVKIVTDDTNL